MKNPVKVSDSIDAMDKMQQAWSLLRKDEKQDRGFLAALKEQIYRHKHALRLLIDGSTGRTDEA
jgi:hypothetical protein